TLGYLFVKKLLTGLLHPCRGLHHDRILGFTCCSTLRIAGYNYSLLLIFLIIQDRGNSAVITPRMMQPQPSAAKRLRCSPAREPSRPTQTSSSAKIRVDWALLINC